MILNAFDHKKLKMRCLCIIEAGTIICLAIDIKIAIDVIKNFMIFLPIGSYADFGA